METTMRRWVALVVLLTAAPLAAAARDFERRVPAESGGKLRADLDVGAIEVESHDAEEVRVELLAAGVGTRRLNFDLESDGSDVKLRANLGGWLPIGHPHVRVRIRVPQEYSVDLRTSGGPIDLDDLEGDVSIRTSGGRIAVGNVEGKVDLRTSGGDIEAGEIEGELDAQTSGGGVRALRVEGSVKVRTSGGPIDVFGVSGPVDLRTSGGSVTVRFTEAPEGSVRASGGSIDVEVPEGEGLDLDARTSGGRVELDTALTVKGRFETNQVDAEINGGGEKLRLQTSGGNIRVRVR